MESMRARLRLYLAIFVIAIVGGVFGFMLLEGFSPVDALYFVIVTMATVGYGDIHPVTVPGKVLAILIIVAGVGTFLGVVANTTEFLILKGELQVRMKKLNMVIGIFFSEVGLRLLRLFSRSDTEMVRMCGDLAVTGRWTDRQFDEVSKCLKGYAYKVDMDKMDLAELRAFLLGQRDFLVRLLENPALLEHESFTDLLRAVFHLAEELAYREDIHALPKSDIGHIGHDVRRAYQLLVSEWLDYMKYLKEHYPYLFHLAMRTNPFDRGSAVIVTEAPSGQP